MPNERFNPALLGELGTYATDIACWRIEAIEKVMRQAPDDFPEYIGARERIEIEKAKLIQKLGGDDFVLEPLMNAIMAYHGEVVFEVYKQAVLDGGRICYAFLTRELPMKEETK